MQLQTAPGTQSLHVEDTEYTPDESGRIDVMDETHLRPLKAMGCTVVGDDTSTLTTISGDAGAVDPALAHENEQLRLQIGNLKDQVNGLQEKLTVAGQVEDELRNRIQELEAASVTAGGTTERTEDGEGGGDSSGSPDASETLPPASESSIKEVNGILVADAEAFDSAEYNFLKEWLGEHGVHAPASIKKVDAIKACKDRFAELTAPATE